MLFNHKLMVVYRNNGLLQLLSVKGLAEHYNFPPQQPVATPRGNFR